MSTFLDRLKKKDIVPSTPDDAKKDKVQEQNKPPEEPVAIGEQLKVDILQTQQAILVYAQIAGAKLEDFAVTIDGDGDIVTISGARNRPNGEHFAEPTHDGKENVLEECSWGKFYRQIILPAEVDAAKTEAKMKDGVLMLYLPLKAAVVRGVRINVTHV
jgi:HSP20 family protein